MMNTHLLASRRRFAVLLTVLIASLSIAFLLVSGLALAAQDSDATEPQEREFVNTIPSHVPIKVKLKKEKEFKDLSNGGWIRDLVFEVKNTGNKPIYFMVLVAEMPDVKNGAGHNYGMQLRYGRGELVDPGASVLPEDVPIQPGETMILKPRDFQVEGYERRIQGVGKTHAKKVKLHLMIITFGDGTGLQGQTGHPTPPVERKERSDNRLNDRKIAGCQPPPESQRKTLFGSLMKKALFEKPVNLLRVSSFVEDEESAFNISMPLPDICGCQNIYSCFKGKLECASCLCANRCQFQAFVPTGSCSSGTCWQTVTRFDDCLTIYNTTHECQYESNVSPCGGSDPTPTPTPEPTPTPTPTPAPTPDLSTRPNSTNCMWRQIYAGGPWGWQCFCGAGNEETTNC